jgi:hypothetical protein
MQEFDTRVLLFMPRAERAGCDGKQADAALVSAERV